MYINKGMESCRRSGLQRKPAVSFSQTAEPFARVVGRRLGWHWVRSWNCRWRHRKRWHLARLPLTPVIAGQRSVREIQPGFRLFIYLRGWQRFVIDDQRFDVSADAGPVALALSLVHPARLVQLAWSEDRMNKLMITAQVTGRRRSTSMARATATRLLPSSPGTATTISGASTTTASASLDWLPSRRPGCRERRYPLYRRAARSISCASPSARWPCAARRTPCLVRPSHCSANASHLPARPYQRSAHHRRRRPGGRSFRQRRPALLQGTLWHDGVRLRSPSAPGRGPRRARQSRRQHRLRRLHGRLFGAVELCHRLQEGPMACRQTPTSASHAVPRGGRVTASPRSFLLGIMLIATIFLAMASLVIGGGYAWSDVLTMEGDGALVLAGKPRTAHARPAAVRRRARRVRHPDADDRPQTASSSHRRPARRSRQASASF